MNDAERDQQLIRDAMLGKDMEAYYKLDASLHPEQKTKKWSVGPPSEVTEQPRYKELQDEVCDKTVKAGQISGMLRDVNDTRHYWLARSKGKLMFKDSDELRAYYGRLAAAIGAICFEAKVKMDRYNADVTVAREAMAALEREYYESQPEVFGKTTGGHV